MKNAAVGKSWSTVMCNVSTPSALSVPVKKRPNSSFPTLEMTLELHPSLASPIATFPSAPAACFSKTAHVPKGPTSHRVQVNYYFTHAYNVGQVAGSPTSIRGADLLFKICVWKGYSEGRLGFTQRIR